METDSMRRIARNGTTPRKSIARESFLLDEDDDLSDDDSAILARSEGTSHGVRSFFDDEPAILESGKENLPMHLMRHPPTPPLTAERRPDQSPQVDGAFERGLPTPGLTPTSRIQNQPFARAAPSPAQPTEPPIELQPVKKPDALAPAHLPFILAYDSEVLAEQLTDRKSTRLNSSHWE